MNPDVTPELTGMTDLHRPKHSSGRLVGLHTFASWSGTADMLLTSSAAIGLVIFGRIGVRRAQDSLASFGSLP
jgi:hypothetical protein